MNRLPLVLLLGVALGTAVAAEEHRAGRDSDRDGLPDSEDWCLGSPPGARVEPDGCAVGQAVTRAAGAFGATAPATAPAPDADGDGVADAKDRCPGSARGTPVDAAGCARTRTTTQATHGGAADADGDTVADERDQCPRTPRGMDVDGHGCVQVEKVVLQGFAGASLRLTAEAQEILRSVAAALKADSGRRVEIGGHTDAVGASDRNQAVSERRAQAVKEFLITQGIAGSRLVVKGYGSSRPVATNATPEGRARNRRVEFRDLPE